MPGPLSPVPNGLAKTDRLLQSVDFERVFRKPCRVGGDGLTLLARPNGLGRPRLGMAISRKAVRSAVRRNRIKRHIRESYRLRKGEIGSVDVVVLARPGIDRLTNQALRATLDEQWRALAQRCADSSSP